MKLRRESHAARSPRDDRMITAEQTTLCILRLSFEKEAKCMCEWEVVRGFVHERIDYR